MTPGETVRAYCAACHGLTRWNRNVIEGCQGDRSFCGSCPLYPYRLGKRISVKVFRKFCLHCLGGDRQGVAECTVEDCPLHPYRFGTNPARQGIERKQPEKGRELAFLRRESTFTTTESKDTRSLGQVP
jgi:hypothetical protein